MNFVKKCEKIWGISLDIGENETVMDAMERLGYRKTESKLKGMIREIAEYVRSGESLGHKVNMVLCSEKVMFFQADFMFERKPTYYDFDVKEAEKNIDNGISVRDILCAKIPEEIVNGMLIDEPPVARCQAPGCGQPLTYDAVLIGAHAHLSDDFCYCCALRRSNELCRGSAVEAAKEYKRPEISWWDPEPETIGEDV